MAHPTERKSSKPRIGAATVTGSAPNFAPTTQGWVQIEQTYGRELDGEDRHEICGIVNKFFDWRRFEKAAPLVDDVTSQIENIEKAARKLNRAFSVLFNQNGPEPEAAFRAQIAIKQAWHGADRLEPDKLTAFYTFACGLVLACTKAVKTVENEGRPWEGQAWDLMIQRLATFASSRSLSITVRKDSARQAEVNHSPFVTFVKAIQNQFPPEVPIRFTTEVSLARAIREILRRLRENGTDL